MTADACNKIADSWGPAITKLTLEGDAESLIALCSPTIELVLQASDNKEASFTLGEGGTFTWDELTSLVKKDMEEQDYKGTESASLGMLGDRMILEAGRINSKDELYLNTVALVTIDADGKVSKFESFADSLAPNLLDAALLAENA